MWTYSASAILLICGIVANDPFTQPPESICSGKPLGYFVRDVRNCSGWFRCDGDGNSRWGACEEERVFSEPRQVCTRSLEECFRCPASIRFVQLEVAGTCNHFIRCIESQAQQLECAGGLHFDPQHGGCEPKERVQCGRTSDVQCPPIDDARTRVWWRDDQHCEQFAVCINGTAVHRTCGNGLVFNTQTLLCDWPSNTDCPTEREFRCDEQKPRPRPVYPHPTDCRRYFVCRDSVAHEMQCSAGTIFDVVNQGCDHPDRSTCVEGAR